MTGWCDFRSDPRMKTRQLPFVVCLLLILPGTPLPAAEPWAEALAQMPLATTNGVVLREQNCVRLLLQSFRRDERVKALVFMPGATDEFYMFHRAQALVTNASPTLMDAVAALTNHTYIRATFLAPLLILHTDEDPITPLIQVLDEPTAAKVRAAKLSRQGVYFDMDYDHIRRVLRSTFHLTMTPDSRSPDSWHFFRHSFAAYDLNGWEALQAITLAGKETLRIERKKLVFEGDLRVRQRPQFPTGAPAQ